jgi:O-antigen ligase
MVSITGSQIFLSFSLVCWLIILIQKKQKFSFPSFFWPLLVYAALSLVSSFLSINPKVSIKDSKELLLFLLVPIVYTGFQSETVLKKANLALLVSAYLTCFYSLYCLIFKYPWPKKRIAGFMGQVMTQGGLLLLFCCMALCMFLFSRNKIRYFWGAGFLLSLFALILSITRNAWIGLVIASCLILFLYKPKTLIVVPLVIFLFYFASPQKIKNRALSSFNPTHRRNIGRIESLRAGIKIIKDYPLFGTGPDTVEMVFKNPKYELSEKAQNIVHLHNNIIQTAAERGIPTLIAWIVFMVLAFTSLLNLLKNKDPTLRPFAVAGLGVLVALFTAGLFEYNFADSEITALFLYLITIPFSLARIQKKTISQGNMI